MVMIPDADLQPRKASAGNLTATETLASFDIGALPRGGLSVEVAVPGPVTGTDETLDITVEHSADDSTFLTRTTHPQITDSSGRLGTGVDVYVVPIDTFFRFIRVVLTIGGTGSPNFGAVVVSITKQQARNVLQVGNLSANVP